MNVTNRHAHARYGYRMISETDYYNLLRNVIETKLKGYLSLNAHLPLEVQHPRAFSRPNRGLNFIRFGERLKKLFKIKLFWENAPAQKYQTWDLKFGQTDWNNVPDSIDLTLDTGHLILGAKNITDARTRIETVLQDRGKQIKHLHLHENDLAHDTHEPVGKIIDKTLLAKLTQNRTYIFEKAVFQED